MKKIYKIIVAILLLSFTLLAFGGCDTKYRINLMVDGVRYDILYTDNYAKLPTVAEPTKGGYHFAGWYFDREYTRLADLAELARTKTKLKADTTLYAKWTEAKDVAEFYANGKVAVLQNIVSGQIKNIDYSDHKHRVTGWYADEHFTVPFDFDNNYQGRVKIYGKSIVFVDSLLAYLDAHGDTVLRDDSFSKIEVTRSGILTITAKDQTMQYDISTGALVYVTVVSGGYKIHATAEYLYRGGDAMNLVDIKYEGAQYDEENIVSAAELFLLTGWVQLDRYIDNMVLPK